MKKLIDYYLVFSKETKAKGTYSYELTISNYLLMFYEDVSFADFDLKSVHNYVLYLKANTELANITINKCLKLLKAIMIFNGYYIDWLVHYKLLKEQKRRFDMLKKEELELVFNYVNNLKSRGTGHQYRLMVYLLFDTGVRQAELLNIKVSDIDLENQFILIRARKSTSDRYVFLSDKMTNILKSYKIKRNKHDLLFYNNLRDREFIRNDLKLFYRRVKKATGVKKLHSHMFRHTYCTDLIELHVPLFVVQQQLGHSSIKTTEIYYHANFKFQQKEMAKISTIR